MLIYTHLKDINNYCAIRIVPYIALPFIYRYDKNSLTAYTSFYLMLAGFCHHLVALLAVCPYAMHDQMFPCFTRNLVMPLAVHRHVMNDLTFVCLF
jgi:hypothetical protein